MPTRTEHLGAPLDLRRTLAPLARGFGDPTMHLAPDGVLWARRTPAGPVAAFVRQSADSLVVEAHGDGADWFLDALPGILGGLDAPAWSPPAGAHPTIRELARRHPGVRVVRSAAVLEALVPAILEQKVMGSEARRAFIGLVRRYGEAAPGPATWRLRLPPAPAVLAALPYYAYHPFGVEQRRAELVRAVARRADWFEATTSLTSDEARARLTSVRGIGPWTAAEVAVRALGDADAVSVGDFHLPHLVSFALSGEPRGTDERMVELLEPYRPHRAIVVRLLELGGIGPPRRGPRLSIQRIDDR